jgi:hypothetical protein
VESKETQQSGRIAGNSAEGSGTSEDAQVRCRKAEVRCGTLWKVEEFQFVALRDATKGCGKLRNAAERAEKQRNGGESRGTPRMDGVRGRSAP